MVFVLCHREAFHERGLDMAEAEDLDPTPFILIEDADTRRIPAEVIAFKEFDRRLAYLLRGLSAAVERGADVANLSVGPPPPPAGRLDRSDPLLLATRTVWQAGAATRGRA